MLSLCAPVTAEVKLATHQGGLSVSEWEIIISKLAAYVNEFKVAGLELLGRTERQDILQHLDKNGKFFHLLVDSCPTEELELLGGLRRLEHFGSLLVSFMPEEAELDESEAERYAKLREFIDKALAVGVEVNACVELNAWACEHLQEIVENASDLGVNHIVCNRLLKDGCDVVEEKVLHQAMETFAELRDLSYSVSLGNCVPNCFSSLEERGCLGGVISAAINEKGEMLPCRCSAESVGNLLELSVTESWHSPKMEEWRQRLPQACSQCTRSELCPGGCRAAHGNGCAVADPLIRAPFGEALESLHEVVLEEDLCPKPRYTARAEEFGWALIRANQVIPVSFKAGEILQLFDGHHSLADIERSFGAAALSFIYSLYVRGFVEFVEEGER